MTKVSGHCRSVCALVSVVNRIIIDVVIFVVLSIIIIIITEVTIQYADINMCSKTDM